MEKDQMTPTQWKNKGNDAFKDKQYEKAIEFYTKAIDLDDSQSVFFSNRARCYKIMNKLQEAYQDANNAIELDQQNIKAQLLCGQILSEQGKLGLKDISIIQTAITRLTKALTLCAGQKLQIFEKDLEKYIKRSKKLLWYKKREQKMERLKQIQKQLFDLIDQKQESEEKKQQQKQLILETMGDPDQPYDFEIQECFCCQISLTLMDEPVTTKQGITYEKACLLEHFQKNGNTDPCTRKPTSVQDLVPNINLKQAIQDYLKENPWAYEYRLGEKYTDIEF